MLNYIINSFTAGVMIALGGTVYLSVDNKIAGSLLFSFGLIMVIYHKLSLYTGKIGYLFETKDVFAKFLLLANTLVFNMLGACTSGLLFQHILKNETIYKAKMIVLAKLSISNANIFILSCLCGVLMFLAVETFKKGKSGLERLIMAIMPVSIFILSGYEHCIANMYYFSVSGTFSYDVFSKLGIMILGNSFGSIIISKMIKLSNVEKTVNRNI